ncbi:siphovirus Gp157 family protein [Leptospira alexanderi]|uniref:siphovirus Gp157 family protein n=1 Tax=Leptospira alexanderi TaxID=100053 RepID=UPI000991274F|nr:siphovirus Gp157 family protein [Leptospira alexanderi]
MSKSTLSFYDLDNLYYEALYNSVDQETGEIIDEELFKLLDEIQEKKEKKLLNMACAYKAISSEALAIKAEEERLRARRRTLENQSSSIKSYIHRNAVEGDKISDSRAEISWRKSTETLVDIEESDLIAKLGEEFVTTKTTYAPNKVELKRAIVEGREFAGVALVTKQNLQIK